ncbi:MAG: hypothetical protein CMLOHMNK_00360 [Steroidobacteraceae bacterium]|nr:hypothetical protein [Steroidobacteraceae bacterium]
MQPRGLKDVLTQQQEDERERALRALLMRPLIASHDPNLELVRKHAEYLRDWFGRETGWNLQVERQCARLYKRPAMFTDFTRGLPEFDRERYALLCLACAVLERAESQVTLRALGERLLESAADPELTSRGFIYTLASARERRALVAVCRLLLDFGVLARVAGDEEAYVNQSGDVLYDVHRRVLARLPSGTAGASLIAATQPDLEFDGRLAGSDPQRAAQLLESVDRVIGRLPARGQPLAQLAAAELEDAHALDAGQAVATLVLRAFGLEQSAVDGVRARDQWARLGITVNELAAPVLCLNLPATGNAVAAKMARTAACAGDPVHLTLRMLLRDPPAWDVSGRRVYVCENPSMLSIAADQLGADCAPLICTNGMPAAAQQTLLRQLIICGANLAYHGDFDWAGIRIGNFVMRELQASAWRFSAQDYVVACAGFTGTLPGDGRVDALWDVQLSEAMCIQRKSIHEEAVWEVLAGDLARS